MSTVRRRSKRLASLTGGDRRVREGTVGPLEDRCLTEPTPKPKLQNGHVGRIQKNNFLSFPVANGSSSKVSMSKPNPRSRPRLVSSPPSSPSPSPPLYEVVEEVGIVGNGIDKSYSDDDSSEDDAADEMQVLEDDHDNRQLSEAWMDAWLKKSLATPLKMQFYKPKCFENLDLENEIELEEETEANLRADQRERKERKENMKRGNPRQYRNSQHGEEEVSFLCVQPAPIEKPTDMIFGDDDEQLVLPMQIPYNFFQRFNPNTYGNAGNIL